MDTNQTGERVGVIVVHGVGDTEPGWINRYVVDRLKQRCPALTLQPFSEAYQLEDRGRSKSGSYFPAYVTRGMLGDGRSVAFLELYWADLSKTGGGPFYFMLAALRLFYEAPFILAHSFMHQSKSSFYWVLKRLVLLATWLLRWPIAGMNTTAFVCSLAVIALHRAKLLPPVPLAVTLCAILAVLALIGLLLARWRMHHDLWLTDVSLATALFSMLAIVVIVFINVMVPAHLLSTPDAYLAMVLGPILGIWVVWSIVIVSAAAMLVPVYLKRLVGWRSASDFPIGRPAAALALVLLQGLIWKVFVPLPSVAIIDSIRAVPPSPTTIDVNASMIPLFSRDLAYCSNPALEFAASFCDLIERSPSAVLSDAVTRLKGVFVFNSLHALYTLVLFVAIILVRVSIARLPRLSIATKNKLMPRVILSQVIILLLLAGSIANLAIYAGQYYADDFFLRHVPGVRSVWLWPPLFIMTVLVLYFFNIFQLVAASLIHIFRDVVDHQYRPRFDSLRFMMPSKIRTKNKWPRRARIQERLNVLIERLVRGDTFDRLVLVAHSQGSVVLYEYFNSREDDEDLSRMYRIDVVTVGSPLTHLYQYYFEEYGRAQPSAFAMNPRLASWINLWRIDDPIGNRVDIVADGFIQNKELGRGGHIDYWREPDVSDAILDAIAPEWRRLGAPGSLPLENVTRQA